MCFKKQTNTQHAKLQNKTKTNTTKLNIIFKGKQIQKQTTNDTE